MVCRGLGISTTSYLGIAALTITSVHESHKAASATFILRHYVMAPALTPYPPNLAHDPHMPSVVQRESCVVSLKQRNSIVYYTPDRSTDAQWNQLVKTYYLRQKQRQLLAAECRLHQVGGRDVLQLNPEHAPVFTPNDWGGTQMNVNGIELQVTQADHLCHRIAYGR